MIPFLRARLRPFLRSLLGFWGAYVSPGLAALVLALIGFSATPVAAEDETTAAEPPGLTQLQRGEAALKQMRFKAARQDLQAARTQFRENEDAAHELEALMLLGQLETAVKNHRLATHYLAQARALLERAPALNPNAQPRSPDETLPPADDPELAPTTQAAEPNLQAAEAPATSPDAAIPPAGANAAAVVRPLLSPTQAGSHTEVAASPSATSEVDAGVDALLGPPLQPAVQEATQLPSPQTEVAPLTAPAPTDLPTAESDQSPSLMEVLLTGLFVLAMGGLGLVVGLVRRKRGV